MLVVAVTLKCLMPLAKQMTICSKKMRDEREREREREREVWLSSYFIS
jgi:predicted nucleic acid-binding Zn ribbon protein